MTGWVLETREAPVIITPSLIITHVMEIDEEIDQLYEHYRIKTLVDGRQIIVAPQAVNWRIAVVRDRDWGGRYWCYEGLSQMSFMLAVLAANAWDGAENTEPVAWRKSWDGRYDGAEPVVKWSER